MDIAPYSNREIEEKWNDITRTLDRIEKQTTKTNGNVAELQKWRYYIVGAVAVLTTLVIPVVFVALDAYLKAAPLR